MSYSNKKNKYKYNSTITLWQDFFFVVLNEKVLSPFWIWKKKPKSLCSSEHRVLRFIPKKVSAFTHHQVQVHVHNHPLNRLLCSALQFFWSKIFFSFFFFSSISWIKGASHCPHVGLIDFTYILPGGHRWCPVIGAGCLVSIPSPRPRVGGSAGRTGRSYGRTVDPTPLIRWGTSGGRTAAAAGWGDWPADAPPPSPRLSVSWWEKKTNKQKHF